MLEYVDSAIANIESPRNETATIKNDTLNEQSRINQKKDSTQIIVTSGNSSDTIHLNY